LSPAAQTALDSAAGHRRRPAAPDCAPPETIKETNKQTNIQT
jgi:hypothetical protein